MANRLGAHDDFQEKTQFFISVGDLMSAVLLVFVFLLVATLLRIENGYGQKAAAMASAQQEAAERNGRLSESYQYMSEAYKRPATAFRQLEDDMYTSLCEEFKDDLAGWEAFVDRETLSIRFLEPEALFSSGSARLTERFERILDDFFPRYLALLGADKFRDDIEEIRFEGHTSSEWETQLDNDTVYFKNMELSMDRTRNVLAYCLARLDEPLLREWVRGRLTANGLSSSKPILLNGVENKRLSRRVEFRVRMAANKQIGQILTAADESTGPCDWGIASGVGENYLSYAVDAQDAKASCEGANGVDTPWVAEQSLIR